MEKYMKTIPTVETVETIIPSVKKEIIQKHSVRYVPDHRQGYTI